MKRLIVLAALFFVGCPPGNEASTRVEDPEFAEVIPITSDLTFEQRLIVEELNSSRHLVWRREHRASLLRSLAILKAKGCVHLDGDRVEVEED